jgi:hypothetical protein
MKKPPAELAELWISQQDGTKRHKIGSVPVTDTASNEPTLSSIQWLPGSNRLSFVYQTALYTVQGDD